MNNEATKAGAMSATEYERQRKEIDATYPKGGKGQKVNINALRDQALAQLAHRSGWTQEQLAEVEGVSQQQIARRMRFGRFLEFTPTGSNSEKPADLWLHDITERKFRGFWEQTEKQDERMRFRAVAALIRDHTRIVSTVPTGARPTNVVSKYADGKWRTIEVMAKGLGIDPETQTEVFAAFRKSLKDARARQNGNTRWESRKYGTTMQYRILKGGGRKIDSSHLQSEIAPILQELKAEGKKNMATACPPNVLELALKLEKLIRELAQ